MTESFAIIDALRRRFSASDLTYWIAGGWGIALFIGRQTRPHKDIDIAIGRADQAGLSALTGIARVTYRDAGVEKLWDGHWLALPIRELVCHFDDGFEVEVLLNEFDAAHWLYHRNPNTRLAVGRFAGRGQALPVEIILLYKAKKPSDLDRQDFELAVPLLNAAQHHWLRQAIAVDDLCHPWLASLD